MNSTPYELRLTSLIRDAARHLAMRKSGGKDVPANAPELPDAPEQPAWENSTVINHSGLPVRLGNFLVSGVYD